MKILCLLLVHGGWPCEAGGRLSVAFEPILFFCVAQRKQGRGEETGAANGAKRGVDGNLQQKKVKTKEDKKSD